MITIENVSKSFGKNQVLKEINLKLEKGKTYGIVGENGAGKTTLFRCIAGLEEYKGEIKSDFKNLKNHMGLLPTDPFFFSKITAKEYLQLLCNARGIDSANFEEKNIFNLPLNQYASTYSTGMKKKLALTGVLLQQNDFFVLDEPFNGVDIQSNMMIIELLHKLKSLDKTVIISSHIFSTLKSVCDEIYLLKEGVFIRKVLKDEFDKLEKEMIDMTVGKSIDKLELQ